MAELGRTGLGRLERTEAGQPQFLGGLMALGTRQGLAQGDRHPRWRGGAMSREQSRATARGLCKRINYSCGCAKNKMIIRGAGVRK